jgi:ATP-dependent helicase/nuclease subunit B
VQLRFLLGPAGSGKTFRCLTEVRQALTDSPEGAPLLWLAPKQTTYQLERQLLADPAIPGYTRLHVFSFERLARFIFEQLGKAPPPMLEEEGRLMVLRGLLARKRQELKLFRASARLTGFAQQLSRCLRELQRSQMTPERLEEIAANAKDVEGLSYKLQDLAALLRDYLDWLTKRGLQDSDCVLASASAALAASARGEARNASGCQNPTSEGKPSAPRSLVRPSDFGPRISRLWVDGFGEFSEQELDLLAALAPYVERATITFCLERTPGKGSSWLSTWSVASRTFERCQKRLGGFPGVEATVERLPRHPNKSRFLNNEVLRHLEQHWAEPTPYLPASRTGVAPVLRGETGGAEIPEAYPALAKSLRLAACPDPEAEALLAAREILAHVRAGGRFRDITVLVRKLENYHPALQRVLTRFEIPFFLDRRESVSHHPLAELTRSALRTVAQGWRHEDWFAALKTGLVTATDEEIDRLENEALARGWRGKAWHQPIQLRDPVKSVAEQQRLRELQTELEELRSRLVPPFEKLALTLAASHSRLTGRELATAIRAFWNQLGIEPRLEAWTAVGVSKGNAQAPGALHATVWEQMNAWLDNVELAFPTEALAIRDWMPILEAGLANLTVGLIPPALDQVLVGAIDRSRNPDIQLALVLGLNETVFPAAPEPGLLLTETDRLALEKQNVVLGSTARQQLGSERYLAYITCTRARLRLVLSCAQSDAYGRPLNPSPFWSQARQLFPSLQVEAVSPAADWRQSEHMSELIGPLLQLTSGQWPVTREQPAGAEVQTPPSNAQPEPRDRRSSPLDLPGLAQMLEQVRDLRNPPPTESVAPELAARLYGPVLRTSVSRLEQFAACPFKFFVHSGMRAEERKRFELDAKEQGTFQHDVLALFHQQLRSEGLRWRDITPAEARHRIALLARGLVASYRDGLLEASEGARFMARVLAESLQDFAETLVGWMHAQYQFDPVEVELPFGEDEQSPAWAMGLGAGQRLELYGRIDRVDLYRTTGANRALCVVVDYKSSQKQLDPLLMANGLQLQLLTYLNVLRHWPRPHDRFGIDELEPAGVFYVNLRGRYGSEPNRLKALADPVAARKLAYRHAGRFDERSLRRLDSRPGAQEGDQFNYRLTKGGEVHKGSREALSTGEFTALLDQVEASLRKMGRQIYCGKAEVSPYRKGALTACDQCSYQAICRVDPWTQRYRLLRRR